jgi:hypothetical protein
MPQYTLGILLELSGVVGHEEQQFDFTVLLWLNFFDAEFGAQLRKPLSQLLPLS